MFSSLRFGFVGFIFVESGVAKSHDRGGTRRGNDKAGPIRCLAVLLVVPALVVVLVVVLALDTLLVTLLGGLLVEMPCFFTRALLQSAVVDLSLLLGLAVRIVGSLPWSRPHETAAPARFCGS